MTLQSPGNIGRVAVALSSGADSAAAAIVLKDRGYDIFGLHMTLPVAGRDEALAAARAVASALDIEFHAVDMASLFEERVLAPFLEGYRSGRTPNPCVICNEKVKFDALLKEAQALGAERLATGHYARILKDEGGGFRLFAGRHREKDQSYFLYRVKGEVLEKVVLPLGELTRADAEKIVKDAGLGAIVRPTSQDLCFLAGSSLGDFLRSHLPPEMFREGPIVDAEGNVMGAHRGVMDYTVGQRRGINIPSDAPLYVLGVEPEKNLLKVGGKEELLANAFEVADVVWHHPLRPEDVGDIMVKVRYRARPVPARLKPKPGGLEVHTKRPVEAPAPGQAAVFYLKDELVGGGTIRCALP